jgi:hypothetical protein
MATVKEDIKHQKRKSSEETVEGANSDEKTAQLLMFYNRR